MIQDIKQDLSARVPRKICYLRDKIGDFRTNSPEKYSFPTMKSTFYLVCIIYIDMQVIVYFMQSVNHGGISPVRSFLVSFAKLPKPLCILHNDGISGN